jgi:hypothetical protein
MGEPGISSEIVGLFPSRFGEIFHVLEIFRNEQKLFFHEQIFFRKNYCEKFWNFFESKKFRKNIFLKIPGGSGNFFGNFFFVNLKFFLSKC